MAANVDDKYVGHWASSTCQLLTFLSRFPRFIGIALAIGASIVVGESVLVPLKDTHHIDDRDV